ncbi:MAG: 16S rRNA (cytosine(1402)-N(4))-methyltransferase RsmH [Chlamydiia bacterium]|nr:16S rRNA (cytosine(1402)-N(4))-methyltransferase RsmH [Chlamydiia bacterium]
MEHTNAENLHTPVLLEEVNKILKNKKIYRIIDCTVGLGGHAESILKAHPEIEKYIGIDLDAEALNLCNDRLKDFKNFTSLHGNFVNVDKYDLDKADVILMDLGVSSMQLDHKSRGFSFRNRGDLDMRMDASNKFSAWNVVNDYSRDELLAVLEKGEVRKAITIADTIVRRRPIKSTEALVDLIIKIISLDSIKNKIHPATLTFQAIRMEVNNEIYNIRSALRKYFEILNKGGEMIIISFHSIEDRIVKRFFKHVCGKSEFSKDAKGNKIILASELFKKPCMASPEEISKNRRSRSAKLRAIKKEI